jgi:flavin-binding protein dodecin
MHPPYVGGARRLRGRLGRYAGQHRDQGEHTMSNRTYRVTEIVGTSPDGTDQAIRNGIERASQTLRHIDWFEVTQVRGQVKDGALEHFQVGLKVGFRLEDQA